MSAVPFTRTLPYVLREQLREGQGLNVLIGNVVSVPDLAHVRVDILGANVTIPKLASYTNPTVGESALVLADPLFTVALGAVSASPPPPIVDAGTLDGIDSTGFLRRQVAGATERIWWSTSGVFSLAGSTLTTHGHTLGRVPAFVGATLKTKGTQTIQTVGADATNISIQWSGLDASAVYSVYLLAIG